MDTAISSGSSSLPDPRPAVRGFIAATVTGLRRPGRRQRVGCPMLGHGSATMTLDTYGHLFENRLDEVELARTTQRQAADLELPAVLLLPKHPAGLERKGPSDRRFRRSEGLFPW
ncbi:MAG: hypothetical protein ABWX74_08075 [Aeromicrobium sp.]